MDHVIFNQVTACECVAFDQFLGNKHTAEIQHNR